jgi:hypothetical protein
VTTGRHVVTTEATDDRSQPAMPKAAARGPLSSTRCETVGPTWAGRDKVELSQLPQRDKAGLDPKVVTRGPSPSPTFRLEIGPAWECSAETGSYVPQSPLPLDKGDSVAFSFLSHQSSVDRSGPGPMLVEVLPRCVPERQMVAHIQNPVMESVTFPSPAPPTPSHPTIPVAGPAAALDMAFVNTVRGSSPGSLQEGVIPTSLESFMVVVSKPLPPPVLQSKVCLKKPRHVAMAPPHRSNRLAKNTMRRTPARVAVQNLLMRKLGVFDADQLQAEDFEKYL